MASIVSSQLGYVYSCGDCIQVDVVYDDGAGNLIYYSARHGICTKVWVKLDPDPGIVDASTVPQIVKDRAEALSPST